jgi:hypothetical protein
MNTSIAVLTNTLDYEVFGSLKEMCEKHNLSYNYLKRKKFPFKYKGFFFVKIPFSQTNGC